MDVLTSETCSALNKEIIKQVTSSWSLFTQHTSMRYYVTNWYIEKSVHLLLGQPTYAIRPSTGHHFMGIMLLSHPQDKQQPQH